MKFVISEFLEFRRLFAAVGDTYSAVIDDQGTLVVTASNHSDPILLSLNSQDNTKLDVTIQECAIGQFDLSAITGGVRINALNGQDRITIDETNGAISLPVTMIGGNGKDIMYGGSGDDSIEGGNGPDRIWAGGGNDIVVAGNGNDRVEGQDGNDFLSGGHGKDSLFGNDGDDDLTGGTGKNSVFGGAGNDDFFKSDSKKDLKDRDSNDDGDNDLDDLVDGHAEG